MKIGKYLLISTAVLGLVNPLAVLADEQTSNSSSRNSDTSITSSADSEKTSKSSEVSTKSDSKVTAASESIPWGDSGFNLTLENGTLHLPSADFTRKSEPNITLQAALENANVGRNEVFKIVIDGPLEISDGRMVFADLSNLESIDGLENLDTSQVTDMTSMFYGTGLINLDLSNFKTSKVTNMYGMFMNMKNLESVNVSSFDTSNVVTMDRMFGNVRDTDTNQLLSLDLSNFDTSKVSTMTDMFKGANSLRELKLGDNFRFKNGSRLLDPERTGQYSGKWQNVGQGTKDNPTGKNEWSTVELTNNYGSGDADTYVWQPRSSTHTVKFYEANGNELPQNKISVSGRIGQEYDLTDEVNLELARLRSDGYKVVSNYGSIKGVFKEIHDGAGYILTKAPEIGVGNVTARYIDENGNDIAKPDFKTGRVGTEFKTAKKDIKGYIFQKVEGLEIGKFSSQNKIVTYIYSKDIVKAADVTVKYVDENGKEIAKSEVKSGNVGDKYTTEKKDITGYTFKEVKGSANGEFTDKAQTVTYIYTKNPVKAADVTVKYVDENGKEIAKSEVKSGNVGDKYTTEKKDITGYTFKEVKGSANGEFTDKAQMVTYIYTKNPEKGADVTVKYVDENGKEIAKSEVKSGNVGDKYTTEKKDITGYTFKEVKGSTNGQFTDKAQTVTYIYTKNPEKGADVTVKYVDENGKEIAKSEVKSGNVGDKYTTEKKDITGYTFKEVQGSANGEFTDKAQTVTYIYTKNDDNVKPTDPSQPAKPDTPDHSGDNNSNTSEQPGNNSTGNDVMNNVVEGVQSVLPKTAAEKVTLAGIVSVVLASLVGLIVWKKRK